MERVTLVNRSSKHLTGTWNGRQFKVVPGEQYFPRDVAEAIKRQNPIMGTQGNEIWDVQYLCGIKEDGDDVSPAEQTNIRELMNPALHSKPVMEVPGRNGLYGRSTFATELPADAGFEKP